MQSPARITFRGLPHSDAVESNIQKKIAWLEHYCPKITKCDVSIESHHHHHHKGNLYHVRIVLGVPGKEIVVSRDRHDNHAHEDAYVAIRDAFDAARRQLEDYVRRRRGNTKLHEPPAHGTIKSLSATEQHGFIEASDGHEVYFHRNSVVDDAFNELEVGREVRFVEHMGEEGYQASTVHLIGKHHIPG